MKNLLILMFTGVLCAGVMALALAAGAEELEKEGLAYFKEAFYKAMPREDMAAAATAFARAEEAFREAIRLDPGRIEPYLYLGRTLFVQQKYGQAAEQYERALRIDPDRGETYLQLASAREMGGDYESAIQTLEALRLKERDSQALQMLDGLIDKMKAKAAKQEGPAGGKEAGHD
jgi:cytochrome c-type biogenesis protein CcmH/NrfG